MSCTILRNPYAAILRAIWSTIINVAQSTANTLGICQLSPFTKTSQHENNTISDSGAANPLGLLHPDCNQRGVGMQIHIKCEGKTTEGLTFDQIALALQQDLIGGSQAFDLITELKTGGGSAACTIVYLLLEYRICASGLEWVVIDTELEGLQKKPLLEVVSRNTPTLSQRKQYSRSGWVYLVKAEELNQYKIGRSRTPDIRLKELQKQSPIKLTLIHLIECQDAAVAETYLHKRFAKCRVGGEWFELSNKDVVWITSLTSLEGVADE